MMKKIWSKWAALVIASVMVLMTACGENGPKDTSGAETEPAKSAEETSGTEAPSSEAAESTEPEEIDIFAVDTPFMEYPQYVFDHEPTIAEMRAAAVDLMRKALSVEWYTPDSFEVTTSVSTTSFIQYERYAGIPYCGPNSSLYGFLEYLNPRTGRLLAEDLVGKDTMLLGSTLQASIGSSCSGTAAWAISAVANSIHGTFQCYYMVYKNGWLPLGDYTYDLETPSFGKSDSTAFTDDILKEYGEQRMFSCYALLEPADLVVWQDHKQMGHTMMAVENAVVVRNADGTIRGDESYVLIQDQRPGGFEQFDETTGQKYHAQGRIDYKYTFARLFKEGYIPVTIAEFQGTKAYEYPEVKLDMDKEITGPDDLNGIQIIRVESNYPLATLALFAENKATGKRTRLNLKIFNRKEVADGTAMHYSLKGFASPVKKTGALASGEYRVTIEARTPNGQIFIPVDFDYTVE